MDSERDNGYALDIPGVCGKGPAGESMAIFVTDAFGREVATWKHAPLFGAFCAIVSAKSVSYVSAILS
jgi:hypothetical protein